MTLDRHDIDAWRRRHGVPDYVPHPLDPRLMPCGQPAEAPVCDSRRCYFDDLEGFVHEDERHGADVLTACVCEHHRAA